MGTKTDEFKKLNPRKTCPTLETKEGSIWSSLAIQRFFASSKKTLYGTTDFDRAHQECLLEWVEETIYTPCKPFINNIVFGTAKPTKPELKAMDDAMNSFMPYLDQLLEENTYLCGNYVTLSDINITVLLRHLYEVHIEADDRKKFRNVQRWFQTMINQKEVKSVVGAIKLKEAKKEVVSSLDMETWKRFYMNNDHKASIEYLWKNIDIKVNGFFVCEYKDFEELKGKKLYLVRNLANGMKQRAQDLCSKNSFGIILITGTEDADQTIKILWLFESKSVPKIVIDELSDYDSFTWRAANWKKDSDKKEIEAYLNLTDPKGTTVLESIVFR